ncbi:MAG: polysaccharide biosynthesis C-terminal domain-containing protein, partial [Clostridia bacterium]|nr:polysaccharide biosynthesis C-terminal domain-containing protein [Clostridia bacterium]
RDKLDVTVDRFELVQAAAATWLYTVTGLMLMPFVRLYTAAMTDISYIRPAFGYVLIAAEVIFCFRSIYSTVSSSANRFKETRRGALLECAVNLTLSLILVLTLKKALLAVAIGTAAGMAARYLWEIAYLSRHLLHRPIAKPLKMLAVSALGALGGIAVCRGLLDYAQIGSVWEWVSFGAATALITAAVAAALYWVFYRQTVRSLLRMLSGRG